MSCGPRRPALTVRDQAPHWRKGGCGGWGRHLYLPLERDGRLDLCLAHAEQVAQVDGLAIVRDLKLGGRPEALWDQLGCRAGDELGVAQGLG